MNKLANKQKQTSIKDAIKNTCEEVQAICQAIGEFSLEYELFWNIQEKLQSDIKIYQQLLAIAQQIKNRELEAIALYRLGHNYKNISQYQKALDYFHLALNIFQKLNYLTKIIKIITDIGAIYQLIEQWHKALQSFQQILPLIRELDDSLSEAITLNHIGASYQKIGQIQQALDSYNQSLIIARKIGNQEVEATNLISIALIYNNILKPQQAWDYYQQAIAAAQNK